MSQNKDFTIKNEKLQIPKKNLYCTKYLSSCD